MEAIVIESHQRLWA